MTAMIQEWKGITYMGKESEKEYIYSCIYIHICSYI